MAVHPIDYRYSSPEMKYVFEEENILAKKLQVEAELAKAWAGVGKIPKEAAEEISKHANTKEVTLARIKEIERETKHDLMAIVKAMSEVCGEAGKYIHLGATSYDIVDTAWALLFKEALGIILNDLLEFKKILLEKVSEYRDLVMIGRTHGQHAVPITLGLKFGVWASDIERDIKRVMAADELVSVGKMSGAVGTGASLGKDFEKVQNLVMEGLGLKAPLVTTQVVGRDRHAQVIFDLAMVGQTLEKIAKEIRNLQRPEINELREPFGKKQVGSSTMPHKRNPFRSERVCGLARYLRSNVIPALENIPLEHERDLTDSSCERIIFPESFILCDFMVREMIDIIGNLEVDKESIKKNLGLTQGRIMGEPLMLKLVEKGLGRQEAHEMVRKAAIKSFEEKVPFKEILDKDEVVKKHLSNKELEQVLNPENYVGASRELIDNILKKLK